MATQKYKKGADGFFKTKVWDGTYNPDGSKHRKNLRSDKSSRDLERKVELFRRQVQMTFFQILKSAVSDHLFPANIYHDIKNTATSIDYSPEEKRPLTTSERIAVFKASFCPMHKIFVYLIYGCGIRRGEALALTIFDFRFSADLAEVTINKSHKFVGNNPVKKDPKTRNGFRTLPIPSSVSPEIRKRWF